MYVSAIVRPILVSSRPDVRLDAGARFEDADSKFDTTQREVEPCVVSFKIRSGSP
jgi:hypothetical protein